MRHQSGCVSVLEHLIETNSQNQMTTKKEKKTKPKTKEKLSKYEIRSVQFKSRIIREKKKINNNSVEIHNKQRKQNPLQFRIVHPIPIGMMNLE